MVQKLRTPAEENSDSIMIHPRSNKQFLLSFTWVFLTLWKWCWLQEVEKEKKNGDTWLEYKKAEKTKAKRKRF